MIHYLNIRKNKFGLDIALLSQCKETGRILGSYSTDTAEDSERKAIIISELCCSDKLPGETWVCGEGDMRELCYFLDEFGCEMPDPGEIVTVKMILKTISPLENIRKQAAFLANFMKKKAIIAE